MLRDGRFFSFPFLNLFIEDGCGRDLPGMAGGTFIFIMKKLSSFMMELLPCGARWEHEGNLAL
jgi:hypothetical protein